MFQAPETTDRAVVLPCDANYLPFALHLGWQIATHSPHRGFDLLVLTPGPVALPDWAAALGLRTVAMPLDADWAARPTGPYGPALYLPFQAIEAFSGRYRRILVLDSDIWFEGGDLGRLLDVDLGPHPAAGVLDRFYIAESLDKTAREFAERGLSRLRYLNSGVVLYDSAACAARDLYRTLREIARNEAGRLPFGDQSVLNLALRGGFAELAPAWNWMASGPLPLATLRHPVRLRHFIGRPKPWADPAGILDARFAQGYADFFRAFLPEALDRIKPRNRAPLGFRELGQRALDHLRAADRLAAMLARFPDDFTVRH